MSFILSITVNRAQEINKQQFEIKENLILNLLSDLSRFALFSQEYQELQPYIENISKDPHVLKVLILNRNNLIMTSSNVSDVGQPAPQLLDMAETYWRNHEVKNAAGILGNVAINFSKSGTENAKKDILLTGIRTAIIGMTIIAIAGFVTGTLLTRRLAVLSSAAQQVKDGNLDAKSSLSGHDEIALLGQTFDEMTTSFKKTIGTLTERESELQTIQNELEQRVSERTAELSFANEELEHLATHDTLTNLPNRSLYLVRLHQAISYSTIDQSNFAVLMIDLDRFKTINDTFGHAVGDELLTRVSRRISKLLRKSDTVARLGGDEFSIVLLDINLEQALAVSKKISDCISSRLIINSHEIDIGSSTGIAMFPEHASDSTQLLKYADMAMYNAKQRNLDYSVFDNLSTDYETNKDQLEQSLKLAIENDDLVLHYQPKIDFSTGKLVGVEALIRWRFNDRLVFPDEFIPNAEKNGSIKLITKWVFNAAFRQLALWDKMGMQIKMSVNISMRDLDDSALSAEVAKYLNAWQVDPRYVILEITETSVMSNPNRALSVLQKIDQLGVNISIDDFGTGYSSLMYLKKLPVDEIKIDRSFVTDILSDSDSLVIVRAIIDLAHNLGIEVTAEGVENKEVWDTLVDLGCNISQGYYTGKPMSREVFEKSEFFVNNTAKASNS
ncbi:MAG: EAL domain-containing protein [Thiohalomonadales bacterium]